MSIKVKATAKKPSAPAKPQPQQLSQLFSAIKNMIGAKPGFYQRATLKKELLAKKWNEKLIAQAIDTLRGKTKGVKKQVTRQSGYILVK